MDIKKEGGSSVLVWELLETSHQQTDNKGSFWINQELIMSDGMLDAVRGCLKEEMRMDVISNNLANAIVIGFKKDKVSFQEILERANNEGNQAGRKGAGPFDSALINIKTDLSQGGARFTQNALDLAISGKGFFKENTPEGIRYTRKGNFSLDAEGTLVTQEGFRVMGAGGPIIISGIETHVDSQGVIKIDGSDTGRIDVVDFENYEDLIKEGKSMFRKNFNAREMAPPPETKIQQGYVELSNVNVADEMVQMIHSLRAFESYQKAIQVLDGLNNRAINEVSRLR